MAKEEKAAKAKEKEEKAAKAKADKLAKADAKKEAAAEKDKAAPVKTSTSDKAATIGITRPFRRNAARMITVSPLKSAGLQLLRQPAAMDSARWLSQR